MQSLIFAESQDKLINEFLLNLQLSIKKAKISKWSDHDNKLQLLLNKIRLENNNHLANDLDYLSVLNNIYTLIEQTKKNNQLQKTLLITIEKYIISIFDLFGLDYSLKIIDDELFENIANNICIERDQLRLLAKSQKNKELFKLCDESRVNYNKIGFRIEDGNNLSQVQTVWKI